MWTGGHNVLGFVPDLTFLWNQNPCRLCKSSSDEATNQSPLCVSKHTHAKRSHMLIKDPVVRVRVQWIMETPE